MCTLNLPTLNFVHFNFRLAILGKIAKFRQIEESLKLRVHSFGAILAILIPV